MFNEKYLENLRCPFCKSDLITNGSGLGCKNCTREYEIREEIAIFTEEGDKDDLEEMKSLTRQLESMPDSKLNSEVTGIDAYFRLPCHKHNLGRSFSEKKSFEIFFSRFPDLSRLRILNVSCGVGLEAHILLEHGLNDLYLLDISFPAIRYLKRRLEKFYPQRDLHYFVSDACLLPFPEDFFDIVFVYGSAHHYRDINLFLKESSRIAKNICLITEPSRLGSLQWVLDLIGWNTEYGGLDTLRFDENVLRSFISELGMKCDIERIIQYYPKALNIFGNNRGFVCAWFSFLQLLETLMPKSVRPTLGLYASKE